MRKSFLRAAAAAAAAAVLLSGTASAAPALSAQKAILMDAASGRVLYAKRAEERSLIASTTKIMTALLVCEQCSLASRVRIPKEAVGIEGSSIYLREGELLTVEELLYGLMLHSGNDAAVALAIFCGGTEGDFVAQMNEKARQLGLSDTHYANPNGLDHDGNYSTAADLARLAAYAMENPDFYRIVSCKTVTAGGRSLRNHNKLLVRYDGAVGVKTGYTKAAGRILVGAAERDGRRLISVTLNAPDDWNDHARLFDYGFSAFRMVEVLKAGEPLRSVPVVGGTQSCVSAVPGADFSYPLSEEETVSVRLLLPAFLYAPVTEGKQLGTAELWLGDRRIGSVPLYAAQTVAQEKENRRVLWKRDSKS